jgi:DNA-directed RNA polymerase specialized sigma24 family protein
MKLFSSPIPLDDPESSSASGEFMPCDINFEIFDKDNRCSVEAIIAKQWPAFKDDAPDIVSIAMLSSYRAVLAGRFKVRKDQDGFAQLRCYLITCAKHEALRFSKSAAKMRKVAEKLSEVDPYGESGENNQKERLASVERALEQESPEDRRLIEMRIHQNLPWSAICAILNRHRQTLLIRLGCIVARIRKKTGSDSR